MPLLKVPPGHIPYRLLEIEENEDIRLNVEILSVVLAKVNTWDNDQYYIEHTNPDTFIFLKTPENVEFFMSSPEDIKNINMRNFRVGDAYDSFGTKFIVYQDLKYVQKLKEFNSKNSK